VGGYSVFAIMGLIAFFLLLRGTTALRASGWSFLTQVKWVPAAHQFGIAAVLPDGILIAVIALCFAVPVSLVAALFISEYAPQRIRRVLISVVDLMAAVPSIIYGLWGAALLQPRAALFARWLSQYFGWIPFFKPNDDPNAAVVSLSNFEASAFIAGIVVAMMVIPIACSVMRGVFAEAPLGEREAAYALGATRWGMVRTVVLPFGRGGIIGGTMLGLGRALGETIAVLLIISPLPEIKFRILTTGTDTISALIAGRFAESTSTQLTALLAAGFVLFVITLAVNTIAAIFVGRSRSGAALEI
jgi:phosphate transport system permease protein